MKNLKLLAHLSCRLAWMVLLCAPGAGAQQTLKVNGSTTVNPIAVEAAEILRSENGLAIQLDTQGGSTGGISALGDGLAQIAMSSRNVNDADRAKYPKVDFVPHQLGEDAVAIVVSADIWDAGVHALSAQQIRDLYEGKLQNWKELGGPDQRIAFFNREPGRGEWEVFGKWLYEDAKKTPQVSHPEVGGNEETRSKVGSTRGGVTFLSSVWADGQRVHALAIALDGGKTLEPSPANIMAHSYPMTRPLFLFTNGKPTGDVKMFVDFLLSSRGQQLVTKAGYLSLEQLRAVK